MAKFTFLKQIDPSKLEKLILKHQALQPVADVFDATPKTIQRNAGKVGVTKMWVKVPDTDIVMKFLEAGSIEGVASHFGIAREYVKDVLTAKGVAYDKK